MNKKVLVIDDDKDMCMLLTRFLTRNHYDVATVHTGAAAQEWMKKNEPDLVLCDFRLGDVTGAELLAKIKVAHPTAPVIIITGYSDVKDAVEVMKLGAYDYVTKPLLPDEILVTIKKAINDDRRGTIAGAALPVNAEDGTTPPPAKQKKSTKSKNDTGYILGSSEVFRNILHQIELVSPTNFSVIIYGESGSGKEVIAQQIHQKSKRVNQPFVAIDCGALSKELAGSELFGHVKGSFTGALVDKVGSFEVANGGTIFLDEIANLSYDIQVSLLRVIQERKMRRVGSNKDIALDVRIIVASNEKLWDAARNGSFREDLYHRFNEFSFDVPPLRDRAEDIMVFASHFLDGANVELEKNLKGFSKEVEEIFNSYIWYGNLRELKNVVKRAALLSEGNVVEARALPFEIINFHRLQFDAEEAPENIKPIKKKGTQLTAPKEEEQEEDYESRLKTANIDAEYEVILQALKQADYNKSKAAKLLNIDRKTLYNKMRQYKEFNLN